MQDTDAFDLLHRLDAFADDTLDPVQQPPPEQAVARLVGQRVLGLVEQLLRFGVDRGADRMGLGLDSLLVGVLPRQHDFDRGTALGVLAFAHRLDDFLGLHRLGLRHLRLHLGCGFQQRLLEDRDRLVHHRALDLTLATDLELAQVEVAADTGLVETAFGGDPRAFDFLARRNFGFLQCLVARDIELFERLATLQPRHLQFALARDVDLLDLLARIDLGCAHGTVGIDPLDLPRRGRDDALLLGDLDGLLLIDLQHLAALRRRDPLLVDRKLGLDAADLDRIPLLDLGGLDRLVAIDIEVADFEIGGDSRGGNRLLLRDPGGLGRLAGGNLGAFQRLRSCDLLRPGFLLGEDAMRRDFLLVGDPGRLHRMQGGDLGLIDRLVAGDGQRADPLLLDDAGGLHQFLRGDGSPAGRYGRGRSRAPAAFPPRPGGWR